MSHNISPRSIFLSSKGKSTSSNDTSVQDTSDNKQTSSAGSSQPPPPPPPQCLQRTRKGSIAQITSASAGKIVRLLRRTHSAGCSKDAPSYALFLKDDKSTRV